MGEKKAKQKRWEKELREIADRNRGVLKAEAVVEYAKDKRTALHSRFCWDDTKAAHEYRLWQARELISVAVVVLPDTGKQYRAYVSLRGDRKSGGGYRSLASVLSDAALRKRMLADAMSDFTYWQEKYQDLRELVPIFTASQKVKAALQPRGE